MATVPLSKERRKKIQEHIRGMAEKDLAVEVGGYAETSDIDASELLTMLSFYPWVDLASQVPKEWTTLMSAHERKITVLAEEPKWVKDHYGVLKHQRGPAVFTITFPNAIKARKRPGPEGWGDPPKDAAISVATVRALAANPDMLTVPGFDQLMRNLDLIDKVSENRDKWAKIERQLTDLLTQVTTVNAAVKVLPQVKFYLPEDIIKKLNEQVTKTAPRVVDTSALDVESISAAGVAAVLTNAQEE